MVMFEDIEKQDVNTKFSLAHIGSFLSERNLPFYGRV
jgi:hypothetical protein